MQDWTKEMITKHDLTASLQVVISDISTISVRSEVLILAYRRSSAEARPPSCQINYWAHLCCMDNSRDVLLERSEDKSVTLHTDSQGKG